VTLEERVRGVVADVLDLRPEEITAATSKTTTEAWDSLAQINIASAVEEEFDIEFTVDEIEVMTSFTTVVATLSRKLQGRGAADEGASVRA